MPENGSPICLYTQVALTTGLLASLNLRYVSFIFAILRDSDERGAEEMLGSGGMP